MLKYSYKEEKMDINTIKGYGVSLGTALLMAGGTALLAMGLNALAIKCNAYAVSLISGGGVAIAGTVGIGLGIILRKDPISEENKALYNGLAIATGTSK